MESEAQESSIDYGAIAAEEITFTFDTVFIVRKANPDFLNVPHWDDLEMTAAYATIDRWQKAMNIE